MSLVTFKDVCIDAVDLDLMADFWASAIGLTRDPARHGSVAKLIGDRPGQTVWINKVPEPQTVKNRVHLDVNALGPMAGATLLSDEFPWRVMADPEGGEFCVFVRDAVPDYRMYEIVVDSVNAAAQAAWWGEVFGAAVETSDEGWL